MIDKIRLLLIEDNRLLREGIVAMLQKQGSIIVKASTGQKNEIDQGVNLFKPHVILLDLGLHSQNSLQVVKDMTRKYPDTKILVMDLSPTKEEIIPFINAGAIGFILKDATPQEFVKAIKTVAKGEILIPELFTDLLLSQIVEQAVVKGEFDLKGSVQITKIELEILKLINEGLSYKDIGEKLEITQENINAHIHNIKQNLSLFSLLELVQIISPKS